MTAKNFIQQFFFITVCCLLGLSGYTQTVAQPKIGFAFSGGGAKGIAHIGALKVLEEEGIIPDFISGTSIGSIVGGLYATGYNATQLDSMARSLIWFDYFNDEIRRPYLPIEDRSNSSRYQLNFPIQDGQVQLPTGFVRGQNIGLLLSTLTVPIHDVEDFDNLAIPFRCVATDFETGEAVVMGKGCLADAIRASMSIPSVFEPMEIDSMLLIDGGIIRNLPVQDVLEMGADMIIAFDVGAPLYKREDLNSVLQIIDQTSSYRAAVSNANQGKLADVTIRPDIDEFTALSFDQVDTLLARGERAARAALPEIKKRLGDQYQARPAPTGIQFPKDFLIESVRVEGLPSRRERTLLKILQISPGTTTNLTELQERIRILSGSQFIRKADFHLLPRGDQFELLIRAKEQSGDFLKVSANYDSNLKAGLLLNATMRNRFFSGSKFSIDFKLSENPRMLSDYIVYLSQRRNLGLQLASRINFFPGFFYTSGDLLEEFKFRTFRLQLNAFTGIKNKIYLSGGISLERRVQALRFFDPDANSLRLHQANLSLTLLRDSYDRIDFPKDGSRFSIDANYTFAGNLKQVEENLDTDLSDFNAFARVRFSKYFPVKEWLGIHWFNDAGLLTTSNDNSINRFFIGRELPGESTHVPFFGFRYMELPATAYGFSGLAMRFELAPDYYASAVFNYGFYDATRFLFIGDEMMMDVASKDGPIMGTGIELGMLTRAGPVYFTTEYNLLESRVNFVLHLGYSF